MAKPLCIDLYAGLGGWVAGFLAEGYDVVGFDIERHHYGDQKYPAQLVLQDVLTLDGRQFKGASVIVASPPCQEYSYMAMPWTLAKEKAAHIRARQTEWARLTALFWACFRIAREAGVPLVVENVKGAQPWVGRAAWHYGSFYLWGDVPALMPHTFNGVMKRGVAHRANGETNFHGSAARKGDGSKVPGLNWNGHGEPGYKPKGFNVTNAQRYREENGAVKGMSGLHGLSHPDGNGKRDLGDPNDPRRFNSRSDSRKAASAQIAKIPFPLAQHIARVYKHG